MKFLHSMIRTRDEEKSIRFYCELIGLEKSKRIRLEDCYLQYLLDKKTQSGIRVLDYYAEKNQEDKNVN